MPQPQHEHAETSSRRSMRARENQQDALWNTPPWPQDTGPARPTRTPDHRPARPKRTLTTVPTSPQTRCPRSFGRSAFCGYRFPAEVILRPQHPTRRQPTDHPINNSRPYAPQQYLGNGPDFYPHPLVRSFAFGGAKAGEPRIRRQGGLASEVAIEDP